MTGLADAVGDVAGVVAGQAWKVVSVVLAGLLLVVGAAGGTGWWLAAGARDQALADPKAEQGMVAQLRAGIDTQNSAIMQQAELARAAESRGAAAQQLAAANGRRFDGALQQLAGARAATCADAMPAVNQLLKEIQ